MNKTNRITVLGIVALFAVLTVSAASAHVFMKYKPLASSVPEGGSAYVEAWVNVSDPDNLKWGQFGIHYDPSCVNVTNHEWGPWVDPGMTSWNANPACWGPGYDFILFTFAMPVGHAMVGDEAMLVNLTVHCESSEYCNSDILFDCGEDGCGGSCKLKLRNGSGEPVSGYTVVNGTFTCGEAPPPETFEKELVAGWNMISLPLYNETDMTVANIIGNSLSGSYSDLYRYDAVNNDWVLLSLEDEMQNGVGYFIYMTAIDTWSYSGLPYNSVEVSLLEGLNCIGWTNMSANINVTEENALGSITDKYNYVAQWNNAPSPKYEVYEQHAPDVFNDFWTLERGEGYWIAVKADCLLKYPE